MGSQREQPVQPRHCSSGDEIEDSLHLLCLALPNRHFIKPELANGVVEKLRAQAARLDEGHRCAAKNGNDQAWKSWTGSNVAPTPFLAAQGKKLRAIEDMAIPEVWNASRTKQVLALILRDDEIGKSIQADRMFHVKHRGR